MVVMYDCLGRVFYRRKRSGGKSKVCNGAYDRGAWKNTGFGFIDFAFNRDKEIEMA